MSRSSPRKASKGGARARPSIHAWLNSTANESTLLQLQPESELDGELSLDLANDADLSLQLPEDAPGWEVDLFGHKSAEEALRALRATRQPTSMRVSMPPVKRVEQLSDLSSASLEEELSLEEAAPLPSPPKQKGKKGKKRDEDVEDTLDTEKLIDLLPRAGRRQITSVRRKYVEQSEDEPMSGHEENSPPRRLRGRKQRKRDRSVGSSSEDEALEEARQKRIRHYDELPGLNVELIV